VATALGVALAATTATVIATANASFAAGVHTADDKVNLSVFALPHRLNEQVLAVVRAVPGVLSADPVIERPISIGDRRGEILNLVGLDMLQPLPRDAEIRTIRPGAFDAWGSQPSAQALLGDPGAIISTRVATRYRLSVGSWLTGTAESRQLRLRVAGILPPAVADVDSSIVFVDLGVAQQLNGDSRYIDRIDCIVDPVRLGAVRGIMQTHLPIGTRFVTLPNSSQTLFDVLRNFGVSLATVSALGLLVAATLIYNGIALSVEQRRPEIRTFRSLGASRAAIVKAFLTEGFLIGVVGSMEGITLSLFFTWFALAPLMGGSVAGTLPDGVVYDFPGLLRAFLCGILIAIAAAILPALDAVGEAASNGRGNAKADLGLALFGLAASVAACLVLLYRRIDAPVLLVSGVSVVAAVGVVLCIPWTIRSVVALGRNAPLLPEIRFAALYLAALPRRSAAAFASMTVASAMMVVAVFAVSAYSGAVDMWASQVLPGDLVIKPSDGFGVSVGAWHPGDLALIAATAGVAQLAPFPSGGKPRLRSTPGSDQSQAVITAIPGTNLISLRSRLIRRLTPRLISVQTTRELRTRIQSIFKGTFGLTYVFSAVTLGLAIFGLASGLAARVLERRVEIATLRYLGFARIGVQLMVLSEAALIGLLAATIGVLLGFFLAVTLVYGGVQVPVPSLSEIPIPYRLAAWLALLSTIAVLLAGTYPARIASRIRTDLAIRVE